MTDPRRLRVELFAVDDRWAFVSDAVFPVVAQFDRQTGGLERLVWWELDARHRDRPASTALRVHAGALWVSSPAAAGMVRIDIATGHVAYVPLDEAPGMITAAADALWIVADGNWQQYDGGATESTASHGLQPHPIVWGEPIPPPPPSGWVGYAPGRDANDPIENEDVGAPYDESQDDFSWDVPGPVWRIVDGVAERVELGGAVRALVPLPGGALFAVLRRLEDPVVKRSIGRGGTSFEYPAVLARCNPPAAPTVIAPLSESGGRCIRDGDRVWLCGFGFHEKVMGVRELDLDTGELVAAAFTECPDAVIDNVAIVIHRTFAHPIGGGAARGEALLYAVDRPTEPRVVPLPWSTEPFVGSRVGDGVLWLVEENAAALIWFDPRTETSGRLAVDVDLTTSAPTPVAPAGIDLGQFEQEQLASLRADFVPDQIESGSLDSRYRALRGYQFSSIELRGRFPAAHVVGRFTASARPGITFARRWNLYDELGNPQEHDLAAVYLMEDIDSGPGLPSVSECRPDAEGVVWF